MNFYLLVLLKSTIITGVAYFVYRFLLRNTRYFMLNRLFLLGGLVLGLILPWVTFTLPENMGRIAVSLNEFTLQEVSVAAVRSTGPTINLLLWPYLLGLAFFTGLFVRDLSLIAGVIRRAKPAELAGHKVLLSSELPSFSFFNKLVFNQHNHPELEDRNQIISHEWVHIREGHSIDLLAAELVKILLWFNPFSWLLKSAVQENCEFLADRGAVVHKDQEAYAELLLESAIAQQRQHPILHHFNQHQIKRRVQMLVKISAPNWRPYLLGLPLIALTAFIVSCSGLDGRSQQIVEEVAETIAADMVDKMAEFPGGQAAMIDYLSSEISYPKGEDGPIDGDKVFVQFVVSDNGKIENTEVANEVHPALAAEAVRVVSAMPAWTPAEKDGKNVKVKLTLPIVFQPEEATE